MASEDTVPPPTQAQFVEAPIGTEQTVAIPASPNFVALRADMVSAWFVPPGELSLSLLSFEGHVHAIRAKAVEQNGQLGMQPTNFFGAPLLQEIGAVRMMPQVALELAIVILRNGLEHNLLTFDQIEKAFEIISIKIQKLE